MTGRGDKGGRPAGRRRRRWLALGLAGLAGSAARAQDAGPEGTEKEPSRGSLSAGGTVGRDVSGYAGLLLNLPGHTAAGGWALALDIDGGRYEYDTEESRVRGTYAGAGVSLVYQLSGAWGNASLGAGPTYARTRLSPPDPAAQARESGFDVTATMDGDLTRGPWQLDWAASYAFKARSYETSADITHAVGERLRLGVQGAWSGGPTYQRRAVGAIGAFAFGKGFEAQLGAGAEDVGDGTIGGYASVGFSKAF